MAQRPADLGGAADARRTPARSPAGGTGSSLAVDDLEQVVGELRERARCFRNEVVTGPGGKQILLDDPAGNPIELFEPR